MKKKLALFIILTLTIMGTVACGSKQGAGTPAPQDTNKTNDKQETAPNIDSEKALTVAWWGNQARNDRTIAALDLYSDQNPNVIFDGQFSEWGDYWNKLAISSAGHSLPDIIQMDYRYLEQYATNKLLVDLKPYIDSGVLDVSGIDQGILNSGSLGDGVYAICLGVNAPSLLYNKSLLDENGITIKDNMTMDEFISVSKEIYEKTGYTTSVAFDESSNFLEYFLRASDILLFDTGKLGANNAEQLVPFFEIYETGIKEGWHTSPSVFAEISRGSIEQSPLVHGASPATRSWCAFAFSNQLTAIIKAAPAGMEVGITTWPSNNPKSSNYLKPSQFFSISTDSKDPEESAKILDFFTNSLEANDILLGERGVPAAAPVAEAIAPKLSEAETMVIEYINNVVTPNSSTINPPPADGANEVADILNMTLEKLAYGQITAQQAASDFFEQSNKVLAGQ